jgi:hypothetical protein
LSALLLTITFSATGFAGDSILGALRKSGSEFFCASNETGLNNVATNKMAEEENNFFIF